MAAETPIVEGKKSEIDRVREWFITHPGVTKCKRNTPGLNNGSSYLRAHDNSIIKLANKTNPAKKLGEGKFGKVVITYQFKAEETIETATKIQRIYREELPSVRSEARRNLDLNLATGALIERQMFRDNYKVYQEMHSLGTSLQGVLIKKPSISTEDKLDLAIKLLIQVDALHSGQTSQTKKKYAHRDIKPANVMVDSSGNVRLIDFGSTTTNITTKAAERSGSAITPMYGAVDARLFTPICFSNGSFERSLLESPTRNYLEDDKMASLRSIFNPIDDASEGFGIFSRDEFNRLPEQIRELLDTTTIAPLLTEERRVETVKFLAALLIAYKINPNVTRDDIVRLRGDTHLQDECIQHHLNPLVRGAFIHELQNTRLVSEMKNKIQQYDAYLRNKYMTSSEPGASVADKMGSLQLLKDALELPDITNTDKIARFQEALRAQREVLSAHYVPKENEFKKKLLSMMDRYIKPEGMKLVEELDALVVKSGVESTAIPPIRAADPETTLEARAGPF